MLYCLPCFFAQFYVVVLILVLGTFYSLVSAVSCLGLFSRYAYIVVRTCFWGMCILSTIFVTFPHFISTFSKLYHSECRYATLFLRAIFLIICFLHVVLWDRKYSWISCGVSEMIRSNQVEMTEERERVEALICVCMFSALFR